MYLHGRAKDVIIRGGHNIDPATVEDALLAHPQVTTAGAVGAPDPHAGEVPVAYVTLAADATVSDVDLREWAAHRVTERAAAPKAVVVLDALPLTGVGKLYKPALRADATRRELIEALREVAGVRGVDVTTEDGSITASVQVASADDEAAVKAVLDHYPVTWRTAVLS